MKLFAAIQCWKGTPPDLKSELLKKSEIAVYVPIPVFKYYHIPVLQHYPLHQLVKQAVPIPINVDVTHDIKKISSPCDSSRTENRGSLASTICRYGWCTNEYSCLHRN